VKIKFHRCFDILAIRNFPLCGIRVGHITDVSWSYNRCIINIKLCLRPKDKLTVDYVRLVIIYFSAFVVKSRSYKLKVLMLYEAIFSLFPSSFYMRDFLKVDTRIGVCFFRPLFL
jgi:hypothetical protein